MTTEHHHISINGIPVEVVRKDIKNLYIRVYPPDGRVRLSAPSHFDDEAVRSAVLSRLGWIRKKRKAFEQRGERPERGAVLQERYRERLRGQIPILLEKWEPIVGVEVSEVRIRRMKTLWGSCNSRARRISINLWLAEKPRECLEYILVHELVHLHERGHNERFYALMDAFMPQWRIYREKLETAPLPDEEQAY